MINPNEIKKYNNSHSEESNINNYFEYILSLPQNLAEKISIFIERFQTTSDILINKLLFYHFEDLQTEFESAEYNLLTFYYFCINEIFNELESHDFEILTDSEIKTKKIPVKISREYNTLIKEISKLIHSAPEVFIRKAIEWQWYQVGNSLNAGYYYIIEDFCDVSKIKKALEDIFKKEDIE